MNWAKRNTRLIVLLASLLGALLGLSLATAQDVASRKAPKQPSWKGYWVCQHTSQSKTCGTYGWARDRSAARHASMAKCWDVCWEHRPCVLDYCEKLK